MIIQRVNNDSQELVFTVVKNVSGGTLSAGASVCYELGTNMDGVRVTTPATATFTAFAGVTIESITNNSKGRVRIYGYSTEALLTNDTSVAIAAGDALKLVNGQTWLSRSATGPTDHTANIYAVAGEAVATATAGAVAAVAHKVWLRTM